MFVNILDHDKKLGTIHKTSIGFDTCEHTKKNCQKDKLCRFCRQQLSNNVILQTTVDTDKFFAEAA